MPRVYVSISQMVGSHLECKYHVCDKGELCSELSTILK